MKLFLKKDILIIFLFVLASFLLFLAFRGSDGGFYEISYDGKTLIRESLYSEKTHTLENGVVITCEKGEVFFASSDCPDKVCIGAGHLSSTGDWAACLPNKTFLKIVEG